jgi:L-asparaginase
MTIKIFITGGTIDSIYDVVKGKVAFDKTYLPEMLKQARVKLPYDLEELMLKDSREILDKERDLIVEKCKNTEEDKIIVSHGTDTIVETAQALGKMGIGKTIVLLGAMRPFSFSNSDAMFNLGAAFSAVQLLPKGVYITMSGKIFHWDNVKKNKEIGEFETIQ